jgi:hypothetical protein
MGVILYYIEISKGFFMRKPCSQTEPDTVEEQPLTVADPSETPAETGSAQPAHTSELLLFPTALPAARKPNVFHTKGLTRDKRQMCLF